MKLKIFFVLLFFALQGVYGSKNKSQGRLKSWFKKSLAILAVNEVYHAEKPQETDPNALACRYTVPDQNAKVMMNYIACAEDPDFEKYLIDNSENCSQIKRFYEKAKSIGECAFKIPKIIVNGALAKFRGESVSHAANVKMLREYLGNIWEPQTENFQEHVDTEKDFDFFRFKNLLQMLKTVPIDQLEMHKDMTSMDCGIRYHSPEWVGNVSPCEAFYVLEALDSQHQDLDGEHADEVLKLTRSPKSAKQYVCCKYRAITVEHAKQMVKLSKMMFPEETELWQLALILLNEPRAKSRYFFVEYAKRILEMHKLAKRHDEMEGLLSKLGGFGTKMMYEVLAAYTQQNDVNLEHVKQILSLTEILYPNNKYYAVIEALNPKFNDVNPKKVQKKYQDLKKGVWFPSSPNPSNDEILNKLRRDVKEKLVEPLNPKNKDANADKVDNKFRNVNFDKVYHSAWNSDPQRHVKEVLNLNKVLDPANRYYAVVDPLSLNYKNINPYKVGKKYQTLKYEQWLPSSSEPRKPFRDAIMKEALKRTYPEVVKEDF